MLQFRSNSPRHPAGDRTRFVVCTCVCICYMCVPCGVDLLHSSEMQIEVKKILRILQLLKSRTKNTEQLKKNIIYFLAKWSHVIGDSCFTVSGLPRFTTGVQLFFVLLTWPLHFRHLSFVWNRTADPHLIFKYTSIELDVFHTVFLRHNL